VGQSATQALLDNLNTVAPGPAKDILTSAIENIASKPGAAGVAFVIGLALALNSASGYIAAFTRASNSIYEVEEGRPFWKLKPLQLLVTLVCITLVAITALALVVSGPLAEAVGSAFGLSDVAVTAWQIGKWPIMLALVLVILHVLYYAAPNAQVKRPWISRGTMLTLVVWILASVGFAFYVANFGSYNETYGSLGGVVVFLLWLWITNIAVLLGVEFNAETERTRELHEGVHGAEDELKLPERDRPSAKQRAQTA
jgi:membrane protein